MTFTLPFPYRIGCNGYNAASHDRALQAVLNGKAWKGKNIGKKGKIGLISDLPILFYF